MNLFQMNDTVKKMRLLHRELLDEDSKSQVEPNFYL